MKKESYSLYEKFCKTFANKTRFEIIRLLMKGPKNVSEIAKKLNFEQSRVSHNLKKLECYGFVICDCKGKERIYSLDKKYIIPAINSIDKYIKKYSKRLSECNE